MHLNAFRALKVTPGGDVLGYSMQRFRVMADRGFDQTPWLWAYLTGIDSKISQLP